VWTDGVLGDPMKLGQSLAVVPTALFLAGAAIIATCLRQRG
jgi:hypothetical protein